MNRIVYTVIEHSLNERNLTVHEVFNMSNRKILFNELYYFVRYVQSLGAELTMVALNANELEYYFICCYLERYGHQIDIKGEDFL